MSTVKHLITEMKLGGMMEALEKTLSTATEERWSYSELLDTLLQSEYDYREEKRSRRRIQAAKFKIRPAFEDFDFKASRSITKAQVKEIYNLKWIEEGRPLLLIGQTGVGKTFIAQAAGLHACQQGKSVLFFSVTSWLENLQLSRSTGAYLKFRDKLSKPDLLIIDDFGMRKLSSMEAQDLCELLEERSIGKSTLITTQLPLDHWQEVITDAVIYDAVHDRLKHASLTFKITGESYRGIKAKKLDAQNNQQ
jgi:DNA replication protein DnaC